MNTSDIFLPDWLTRCAENHPQRLAVQCENVQWSFAELDRQASRIALQLSTSGVREGSRIALLAANGLPYVASVHALTRLGAILVPLNVRLTLQELCWQLRDVNASLLVCDADYASLAREIIEAVPLIPLATLATFSQEGEIVISDLPENDVPLRTIIDLKAPQAIIYTSGTTGQPKGAIITFGMQWWNAIGSALNLGHSPDDRWLACLPLFHNGSLSILMRSVIYATSVIIHKKFDPDIINQAICEDKITIISVVAVMLQRILNNLDSKAASYPSTLRCVLLGGGPAPYPLLPVRLRIMHDDKPALPGEHGEIFLKGPTITPGYIDSPEAPSQTFHDGWFATGDIGYLDNDGYLYVLDRRSDLIITGGENIYPAEIESVLQPHPAVEEAGVCGQADPQWGQVPLAFVVLKSGSSVSVEELLSYTAQKLARYKQPRAIYVTSQLPRTSSGKLVRRELSELLP